MARLPGAVRLVDAPGRASSSAWSEVAIGEIADVVGGGTPSTKQADNFDGEIPWLTPKDLSGKHDRYVERGERSLSQKGLNSSSAKLLPAGSVLLSTRAPIGYVALAKNPIATNQGFRSLVLRDYAVPEYLYYWLKLNTDELERHASGSTFRELSGSSLKGIRLRLPPLDEQHTIARILGALDDRIELSWRMSETLAEMAGALFRSWFVDFDPVRAKAEGRPSGLPPDLDALFPASFEASELGEIPARWEVIPAGEAMTVYGGSTPSTKEPTYWGGEHCFATPKDLSALQEPILASTARRLTGAGIARIRSGLLPTGTVLLSSRAPIGYLAVTETPVTINQGIVAMVCDGPVGASYALHWTRSNMNAIEMRAGGTTFAEISKSSFREIPFLVPGERIHAAWETLVAPLYHLVASNARQSRSLAEQRDALLPWLMSGRISTL